MKTKIILLFLVSVFTFNMVNAQSNVNDYKYVIVPNKFDFLQENNQYRLNNLTKLLFEKYGFTSLMEDEVLPDDAIANVCLALKSNVIREKGMFNSKLRVQLKNCKGEVVFTSQLGQSREKKYQVAYTLALREAFNSFAPLNYTYKENAAILSYGSTNTKIDDGEVEKLKEEISQLKEEKEKLKAQTKEIPQEVKPQVVKPKEPVVSSEITKPNLESPKTLYAKDVFNGYNLVNDTSKVVMRIYTSGAKDVFIVKGKDAIIYKKNDIWIYSETNEQNLLTRVIDIKF